MGNRDKRGREKKKPKKAGIQQLSTPTKPRPAPEDIKGFLSWRKSKGLDPGTALCTNRVFLHHVFLRLRSIIQSRKCHDTVAGRVLSRGMSASVRQPWK
jgi:hypothetical protein